MAKLYVTFLIIIITTTITFIPSLIDCSDEIESIIERLDEIDSRVQANNLQSSDEFAKLIEEYTHLIKQLKDLNIEDEIERKEIHKIIDFSIEQMIIVIIERFEKIRVLGDRQKILDASYKLRHMIKPNPEVKNFNEALEKLDYYLTLYRFDIIYNKVVRRNRDNHELTFDTQDQINDLLSLEPEYNALKDGQLKKLTHDNGVRSMIAQIDVIFETLKMKKIHKNLLSPYDESNEVILREAIDYLKGFLQLANSPTGASLVKRYPKMMDKVKELQDLSDLYYDETRCKSHTVEDYDKISSKYEEGLMVQKYIESMRSEHLKHCLDSIEFKLLEETKKSVGLDAAIARLDHLVSYIRDESQMEGDFEIQKLDAHKLSSYLIGYLNKLGLDKMKKTQIIVLDDDDDYYDNDIDEDELKQIDIFFSAYIKRHCDEINSFKEEYESLKAILNNSDPSPSVDFWSMGLDTTGDFCKRISKTEGRDWYLVKQFLDTKPTLDQNVGVPQTSADVFKTMRMICRAEPAITKIVGRHKELVDVASYRIILGLKDTPASKYEPKMVKRLRNIIPIYKDNSKIFKALNELRRKKIADIIEETHNNLKMYGSLIQPDVSRDLEELRSSLEMDILRHIKKPKVEDRIVSVYRPGITSDMIRAQLEAPKQPKSKRQRTTMESRLFILNSNENENSIQVIGLKNGCKDMILDLVRQRAYIMLSVIQEQDYGLMSNSDLDFMIEFMICENFP